MTPLVSIILPTYNDAEYLGNALRSLIVQEYKTWEAIIVNNFSDDNTIEIAQNFEDPRIKIVNFQNHGVIAASRNEAMRLANGEIIAFLDSDDYWFSNKLSKCVEKIRSGYDLVCHGEVWQGPGKNKKVVTYGPLKKAEYERLLYRGNCISTSAVVLNSKILTTVGLFDEDRQFITAEDYDYWMRIAKEQHSMCFLDEVLGVYRIHKASASRAFLKHRRAELAVFNSHYFKLKKRKPLNATLRKTKIAAAFIKDTLKFIRLKLS